MTVEAISQQVVGKGCGRIARHVDAGISVHPQAQGPHFLQSYRYIVTGTCCSTSPSFQVAQLGMSETLFYAFDSLTAVESPS